MSEVLTVEPQTDLLARALTVANAKAREYGIAPERSRISISRGDNGGQSDVLCIHYGALDYIKRRGGGLLVYVEEQTAQVQKVVQTQ